MLKTFVRLTSYSLFRFPIALFLGSVLRTRELMKWTLKIKLVRDLLESKPHLAANTPFSQLPTERDRKKNIKQINKTSKSA